MTRLLLLALVAVLGLAACGSDPATEAEPAVPTDSTETPEAAIPDVARIVCRADGTQVETPVVKPQPDGVHLEFVNETGKELAYSVEDPSGSGVGASVPAEGSTEILDLHPGTVSVACDEASTEDPGEAAVSPLEIVDRDGVWVSADLACGETFTSMISDYAAGTKGEKDPLAAAQKALEEYVKPGDVVEPAGYPEAAMRLYL